MTRPAVSRLIVAVALLTVAFPPGAPCADTAADPPPVTRSGPTAGNPPARFELHLDDLRLEDHTTFEPVVMLDPGWDREMRLSLWSDPQVRVAYALTAELSMVGRTGLVHGGHMLGLGLGTTAIGDQSSPTARLLNGERSWKELSSMEKFQVGADTAIALGFLWALLQALQ